MPARIEVYQAGIAVEFECANSAGGRQKPKSGDYAKAQARKRGWMEKRDCSDWMGYSNNTSSMV